MTDPLRHVVARAMTDGLNETCGFLIPQIIRRDIVFRTRTADTFDHTQATMPGIVLIGGDTLEPLARAVGRVTLKILATDELLWLPLQSARDFGDWTIEAVPLTAWMRLTARPDHTILRASGINPETGQPTTQEPR
jgi:hypothetical protein